MSLNAGASIPVKDAVLNMDGIESIAQRILQDPEFQEVPGTTQSRQRRALAAAVAFLVAGSLTDGSDFEISNIRNSQFHPLFHTSRTGTKDAKGRSRHLEVRNCVKDVLLDLVRVNVLTMFSRSPQAQIAALQRLTGGAAVWMHTDGTRRPGSDCVTEEAIVDVFCPMTVLRDIPGATPALASLVQDFIDAVGLQTMIRVDEGLTKLGWSSPNARCPPPRPPQPLLPRSSTSRVVYYGRRAGELERLLTKYEEATTSPAPRATSQGDRSDTPSHAIRTTSQHSIMTSARTETLTSTPSRLSSTSTPSGLTPSRAFAPGRQSQSTPVPETGDSDVESEDTVPACKAKSEDLQWELESLREQLHILNLKADAQDDQLEMLRAEKESLEMGQLFELSVAMMADCQPELNRRPPVAPGGRGSRSVEGPEHIHSVNRDPVTMLSASPTVVAMSPRSSADPSPPPYTWSNVSVAPSRGQHGVFGAATDDFIREAGLPAIVHEVLWQVEGNCGRDDWYHALGSRLDYEDAIILQLLCAMHDDRMTH